MEEEDDSELIKLLHETLRYTYDRVQWHNIGHKFDVYNCISHTVQHTYDHYHALIQPLTRSESKYVRRIKYYKVKGEIHNHIDDYFDKFYK